MNRSLKIVSVIFGMCAGCGEPAPPSLPLSVVPQGYAIVSDDWTPNQVSVCDLVLTSKSAEDIRVKVAVTRPEAGVVFTETVTLPSKGRAFKARSASTVAAAQSLASACRRAACKPASG